MINNIEIDTGLKQKQDTQKNGQNGKNTGKGTNGKQKLSLKPHSSTKNANSLQNTNQKPLPLSSTQELPNNQQFQPAGSYSNRDQQLESFEPNHMMQSIEDDQMHPLMVQNFFNTNTGSNTYPAASPFPDEMLKNLYPPQGNNQDQMQQD